MAKSDSNPLSGKPIYIPNYVINSRDATGFEKLITSGERNIINIFPEDFADREEDPAPNSEYNRRAGIGKSVLLRISMGVFHEWREKIGDKSYRVKNAGDIPIIDFSSTNFNTRAGILVNILKAMRVLDSDLEKYFEQNKTDDWKKMTERFPEIIGEERQYAPEEDDPSHVAATLFEKLTEKLYEEYLGKKKTERLLLFFDSFDEQYVGAPEVSLHRWLVNTLFPWLVGVMQVNLVVAGRERLKINKEEVAKLIKRVELHRFDQTQVKKYFELYFEDKNITDQVENSIWEKITALTDGKPIFVNFVCDLARRDVSISKGATPLVDSLNQMCPPKVTQEQQRKFKTYLVNRLHLRNPQKMKGDMDANIYFRAEVIRILSVAKHGLDHEQYQQVRDDGSVSKQKAEEVKHYFKNTFTSERLPYVKNRGEVRLLHDEISELLQEYHWDIVDPERKEYNKRLRQITRLYEEQLLPTKDESRYSRLLEYIEYRFSFRGKAEETAAINRYLYEFSLHLDNFPDLCAHLNAKAHRYYDIKKSDFDTGAKPKPNTLSFVHDFPLLAKIPIRTIEYLLTERASNDWNTFIERYLQEIREYMAQLPITYEQTQALKARLLSAEGEMLLWKNEWEKGEAKISEAKKLFYLTGDSHAQDWCEHLLGFELQRRANFSRASQHHQSAINSAIVSLSNLCDEPETALNHPEHYANHYRLRLLVKVLCRAGGNTAVNHRYEGRVVEGIKTLQSFNIMAQLTGKREMLRYSIFHKQLDALLWKTLHFDFEDKTAPLFQDVLLQRRLTFSKLIYELRQIGGEDRYYRMTSQEFDAEELKDDKDTARMKESRERLREEFSPAPAPLTYPKLKKVEITQPYEEVRSRIHANRENADLYYQFGGRVVLATKYSPDEKQSYFEVSRTAYENALTVAHEAGFEFLEMQSLESMCRLHYLAGNEKELNRYISEFEKKRADLDSRGYAPYNDLLSKYWLTQGDKELQVLDGQRLSADNKPTVVEAYINMLLHAVRHNQHLYHLILEIFAQRVKLLFSRMPDSEIVPFKRAILRTVEASELIEDDKRFLNYLGWLLQAVTLHRNLGHKEDEVLSDIKKGIQRLMRRGEFIKAGTINDFLIEHYEEYYKSDDKKEKLAHRLYQQVYIYQGANKHSKVKELLRDMSELSKQDEVKNEPLHPAHLGYDIAKAVHLYRTADIWAVERFILGELEHFREEKQEGNKDKELFEDARTLLEATIVKMSGHLNDLEKPDKKLYAEALFRLGELYILSGEQEKAFSKRFGPKLAGLKELLPKEELKKADERSRVGGKLSPAIYTLNLAYLYARHIGDTHRDADALQSIANALYSAGVSRKEDERMRIVDKIKNKVIQKCKDERQEGIYRYPVVAAKMHLVEGDVYFSELFELKPGKDGAIEAKVREGLDDDQRKRKALLHRMMWAYLSALNRLADPNKVYQNFHFDNMLLEINRRILLIPDRAMIKMLKEGLPAAWNIFRELQERKEPLQSIETELALHEVSLKVKAILPTSS